MNCRLLGGGSHSVNLYHGLIVTALTLSSWLGLDCSITLPPNSGIGKGRKAVSFPLHILFHSHFLSTPFPIQVRGIAFGMHCQVLGSGKTLAMAIYTLENSFILF